MTNVSLNDEGLLIESVDLSTLSPGQDDHGRLYAHDGSSAISIVGGGTESNAGYYMWDDTAGAWNPMKATVTDADTLDGNDSTHFATSSDLSSHESDFNNHESDTSNPHSVTNSQVGVTSGTNASGNYEITINGDTYEFVPN
jgi:hypothetical protein